MLLKDPVKLPYTFLRWYDNLGFIGSPVLCIPKGSIGDKALYAKWKPLKYTVNFTAFTACDLKRRLKTFR